MAWLQEIHAEAVRARIEFRGSAPGTAVGFTAGQVRDDVTRSMFIIAGELCDLSWSRVMRVLEAMRPGLARAEKLFAVDGEDGGA